MRLLLYKIFFVNSIHSAVVVLLALVAVTGMSCEGGSKSYTNFPCYFPPRPDDQRCLEEPSLNPTELDRQHDSLFAHFLSPEHRPADDERMFYVIMVREGAFLTVRGNDGELCLLLFSSPIRANYYGSEVLGYDKPQRCTIFSASEIADDLSASSDESGVKYVTLDKCVHCNVQAILPWTNFKSADDVLTMWAVFSSTKILMRQALFDQARLSFEEGDLEKAKSICLDVIECTDIDYPEVHLLLGKCAVRLHDDRLKNQVYDFLKLFEQNWTDSLRAFEEVLGHTGVP